MAKALSSDARGRGATNGATSTRFNLPSKEVDGDWADDRESVDGGPPPLRTTVTVEKPKTILSRNTSPDVPFDRSINAYRGCEHGCIYCFARPTHAYHDLSPGLDFESRLFAKPDAANLLRAELSKRGYSPRPIAMGTNTDPYQPIESDWKITRSILELLLECRHPVTITTKSNRVLRDIDLLSELAKHHLTSVGISVTSLDPGIARTLEPRAPTPPRRIAAIKSLSEAGIPVGMMIAPVVPAITDHEMEAIMEAGSKAGACFAAFIPVRLPHEVAPLFREWLDTNFPDRAAKVMNIIRDIRGGRDNDPNFGSRMRGQGVWAELFRIRFHRAAQKYGLNKSRISLDCGQFLPPEGDQPRLL